MGNFGVLLPAGDDIGIDDGIPPQEGQEDFSKRETHTHEDGGAKDDEKHAFDDLPIVKLSKATEEGEGCSHPWP